MKKLYIEPSIDMIETETEDMICDSIDKGNSPYSGQDLCTKERENINFSDDSDWGF